MLGVGLDSEAWRKDRAAEGLRKAKDCFPAGSHLSSAWASCREADQGLIHCWFTWSLDCFSKSGPLSAVPAHSACSVSDADRTSGIAQQLPVQGGCCPQAVPTRKSIFIVSPGARLGPKSRSKLDILRSLYHFKRLLFYKRTWNKSFDLTWPLGQDT